MRLGRFELFYCMRLRLWSFGFSINVEKWIASFSVTVGPFAAELGYYRVPA